MNAEHCGASLREAVIYIEHENELYQSIAMYFVDVALSITVANTTQQTCMHNDHAYVYALNYEDL